MKEFDFVTERTSSKIERSANYPIEFEVGTPVVISNLDAVYKQIVAHSLASIKYRGKPVEIKGTTYQNGQDLLFIRECALLKTGTEINFNFDSYEEEKKEERLLHLYYPYFVNVAKSHSIDLYLNGVNGYVPQKASDLIHFLDYADVPPDMTHRKSMNHEHYVINKFLGCLERFSTFQSVDKKYDGVPSHTHFIMDGDSEGLLLSGSAYRCKEVNHTENPKATYFFNDGNLHILHLRKHEAENDTNSKADERKSALKDYTASSDLFWVYTKGEASVIYIRLDRDDIKQATDKDFHQRRNQVIEAITRKGLNYELLGTSMTFTPFENNRGRFILSAVIQG